MSEQRYSEFEDVYERQMADVAARVEAEAERQMVEAGVHLQLIEHEHDFFRYTPLDAEGERIPGSFWMCECGERGFLGGAVGPA
jgi:hypothetical protein